MLCWQKIRESKDLSLNLSSGYVSVNHTFRFACFGVDYHFLERLPEARALHLDPGKLEQRHFLGAAWGEREETELQA